MSQIAHRNREALRARFRADPEGVVRAFAEGESGPAAQEAQELLAQWLTLRGLRKERESEKKKVAAGFRGASAAEREALKDEMRRASQRLEAAESQLRLHETTLLELLHTAEAEALEEIAHGPPWMQSSAPPAGTSRDGLRIEPVEDGDEVAWAAYVAAHPRASLYHDFRWRFIVRETMGQRCMGLVARDRTGEVCGVLPLFRLSSRLFGDFAVSVPYLNYGGPLADDSSVESALVDAAAARASIEGLDHLELRELHPRDGWPARTDKVAMVRRMPGTAAELGEELGAKIRSQIRRGEREGLYFEIGTGTPLLDAFYEVFARNMRDLGTPVYARRFFSDILRAFPSEARLVVGWRACRPVTGAFLLRHGHTMEIPWASTDRAVAALSVNMALYWRVLTHAIDEGCRWFDFGRSTVDSGTHRFKEQWGACQIPMRWHYWLPSGKSLPALNPDNPKYHLMIAAWRKLPIVVTTWLGPPIVRSLP